MEILSMTDTRLQDRIDAQLLFQFSPARTSSMVTKPTSHAILHHGSARSDRGDRHSYGGRGRPCRIRSVSRVRDVALAAL